MCVIQGPSCRLCLAENIQEPFVFLPDVEKTSQTYMKVLRLQTSLIDANIFPHHVCKECLDILDTFLRLQSTALRSEKFLLRHQQVVRNIGLKEAKLRIYFKNDLVNLSSTPPVIQEELTVKERRIISNVFGDRETVEEGEMEEPSEEAIEEDHLNIGKGERLQCPSCADTFTSANKLKLHMLSHDNIDQERLECPKCPGKTFAKSTFVNHIREVHRVGKHISCSRPNCTVKFRKRGDMVRHIAVVHDNKKELCTECGESFKNLKYHQTTVHQGLRFKCKECNKEYRTQKMLKQHTENVHDLKRSICEICAVEVIDLKNHMRLNHEGPIEKREPCLEATCDRKFRTLQEARKHHRSFHLDIKEMCGLCGGWFKALYQHMLAVHKADKKHVCSEPHCEKGFSKKHDLVMHRNRVHLGIKYVCGHCGKQVSKLRDHIKLVHGGGKKEKRVGNKTESQQLADEERATANSTAQINDIIKRCVSNIDQTMSSCRLGGLGPEGLLLDTGVVPQEDQEGGLTDFSVYAQLPSLHTVLETGDSIGGLLGGQGREAKEEKELYLEGGERGTQLEAGALQEGEGGGLQVYQWLPSNM